MPKASRSIGKGQKGSGAPKSSGRGKSPPEPRTKAAALIDRTNPTRHLEERQKKLYNMRQTKCLVDLASKEALKTWPGYVVMPNGEHGPSPESLRRPGALEEYKRRFHFGIE